MIIRDARLADIPQLARLLNCLFDQEADFQPDTDKQERALDAIIRNPAIGRIFVMEDKDIAMGMVSLLFTISTAQGGPVCWLEDMVVTPEMRGRSIGTRLLRHAIDQARLMGLSRISLLTDRVNSDAQRFYARNGFNESAMTVMRIHI